MPSLFENFSFRFFKSHQQGFKARALQEGCEISIVKHFKIPLRVVQINTFPILNCSFHLCWFLNGQITEYDFPTYYNLADPLRYTDVLLHVGLRPVPDASRMELHWDSWQQAPLLPPPPTGPFPTTPSSSSASISKVDRRALTIHISIEGK